MAVTSRRVRLHGCVNFRDVGGYPTADGRSVVTGRLFRSDGLHALTLDDVACVRDQLGIRTVFDLRSPAEVAELTTGSLYDDDAVRHVHAPVFTEILDRWELAEGEEWTSERGAWMYSEFLVVGRETIGSVVRALTEPSTYPAVLHCVAGRDRTGVLCALLLATLGVSEHDIVDDYLLTGEVITEFPMDGAVMTGLLRRVRETYGSAEGYFRETGLSEPELARLRDELIA
jgi:protein-tyrosine phosphatase